MVILAEQFYELGKGYCVNLVQGLNALGSVYLCLKGASFVPIKSLDVSLEKSQSGDQDQVVLILKSNEPIIGEVYLGLLTEEILSESAFVEFPIKKEHLATTDDRWPTNAHIKMKLQITEQMGGFYKGELQEIRIPEAVIDATGRLNLIACRAVQLYKGEIIGQQIISPDQLKKGKTKSDQVVYDEAKGKYTASLTQYGTNLSAPAIVPQDVTSWKNRGINKVNRQISAQFEELKKGLNEMQEKYDWNKFVYQSEFNFEPVFGEVYHLYEGKNKPFVSMIPPEKWASKTYLGSFRLDSDQIFEKVDWTVVNEQST